MKSGSLNLLEPSGPKGLLRDTFTLTFYVYEDGHILWPKHVGLVKNKYRGTTWK